MPCFRIIYHDRHGPHETTKWANTPAEAIELVKKARAGFAMTPIVGKPVEVIPCPFSDEARELKQIR